MLLALVLAACVAPAAHEWVEITQQHYRKSSHQLTRPTSGTFYPAEETDDVLHALLPADETSPSDDVLIPVNMNRNKDTRPDEMHMSVDRKDHRRPIHKYEDLHIDQKFANRVYINHSISEHHWNNNEDGNIKRVGTNKIRPNITPEFSMEVYGQVTESEPEQVTTLYSNINDKDIFSATIERVPTLGSVKRVQLTNTPVKSPSVTDVKDLSIRKNDIRPYKTNTANYFSDEIEVKADIFKKRHEDTVATMWKHDRTDTSTNEPVMIFKTFSQNDILHSIKTVKNEIENMENNFNKINISTVEDKYLVSNKHITNVAKTKEEDMVKKPSNFIAKKDKEDIDVEDITLSVETNNNVNAKSKANTKTHYKDSETDSKEEIKVNTMENVLKFVKVVADTISKNTKGVNGKVKYLTDLKETLLHSIKARIDATWPEDAARSARAARSPRGHVEFPSSESSLMTISFLTFAVFLIKLVLQVIQTYKNKTMMVAPLVVATAGRALPP